MSTELPSITSQTFNQMWEDVGGFSHSHTLHSSEVCPCLGSQVVPVVVGRVCLVFSFLPVLESPCWVCASTSISICSLALLVPHQELVLLTHREDLYFTFNESVLSL